MRNGDGTLPGDTEAPVELYGDFGLSQLPHGTTLDTYLRLEQDLLNEHNGQTDFFSGVLRIPAAPPGVDVQLGRQIVAESPVAVWDADSGQIRVGLGGPYSVTVFGGQPRYWEPTYSSPSISQNEQVFGGSLRIAQFQGGALAVGYLQQNRQGREIMQQITASGTRSFAKLPGLPSLYGNVAFDADHQNLDRIRAGVQSFVWRPTLQVNLESTYYKPQDNGKVFIQNLNRQVACQNCHRDAFCINCHQNRDSILTYVHERDYLSYHSVDARSNPMQCGSCHREDFCANCHAQAIK